MDQYLKYLNRNLEMTLGKKMTIGKVTKILGVKSDEEIKQIEEEGKKILDVETDDGLRLGDIKSGSILYETFNEFEKELEKKGVDFDRIQSAWYVWRKERMKEKMESFDKDVRAALEVLINETIEHFHDDEGEVEEE